jgi:hypothetical protein
VLLLFIVPILINRAVGEFILSVTVIPAKAGIQKIWCQADWMPAFAGMTEKTPRPLN